MNAEFAIVIDYLKLNQLVLKMIFFVRIQTETFFINILKRIYVYVCM